MPTGVSKVLQAMRESRQGVTTSGNYPVLGEDGRGLQPGAGESVAKALGFRPLREARARSRTSEAVAQERRYAEKRDSLYARFRAFALDGGRDVAGRQALVADIEAYNRSLEEAGLSARVAPITKSSLLRQTERLSQPTKREQARLDGGQTSRIAAVTDSDVVGLSHPYHALRRAYLDAKRRYDALRDAGDLAAAARVRSETRLPRLRMLVGRVEGVHEEMSTVRRLPIPDELKERRLGRLRDKERREMDRAARAGAGFLAAMGE